MALFIVPLNGPKTDTQIPLFNGFTIGRKKGDLILEDDPKVSGTHAKVSIDNKDQFILVDQNSSNGLILNGRKVKKVALMPGVIFTVGQTEFRVTEVASTSSNLTTHVQPLEVPVRREPLTWPAPWRRRGSTTSHFWPLPSPSTFLACMATAAIMMAVDKMRGTTKLSTHPRVSEAPCRGHGDGQGTPGT